MEVPERKDERGGRRDPGHLALEAADATAGAAVASDLFIDIADETDLELLGQELRRTPIEVHVDAVLVLGRLIGEIVGEAEHAGEFMPGLRIEISVAAAAIDCPMSDADIREARRIVGSARDAPGDVGHIVVTARIPAKRRYRKDIPKARHRVADAVEAREWECAEGRPQRAFHRPRQGGVNAAVN